MIVCFNSDDDNDDDDDDDDDDDQLFCGMVDRRKTFSLISSRDHCQILNRVITDGYFIYFRKVFRWSLLIKINVKNRKITLKSDDFLPKDFTALFSRSVHMIHPINYFVFIIFYFSHKRYSIGNCLQERALSFYDNEHLWSIYHDKPKRKSSNENRRI